MSRWSWYSEIRSTANLLQSNQHLCQFTPPDPTRRECCRVGGVNWALHYIVLFTHVPCLPESVHLFIFWIIVVKNWPISIIFGTLNPRKFHINILQICPPHVSDVANLPWEIQTSHFSILLFIYFWLLTFAQTKTSSNCCSAALAVYLLLFSASYYLHSPGTASWARYKRRTSIYIYKRQVLRQKLKNGFAAGDERWPAHSVTPADENRLCLMSISNLC